jgi:hypothetical protein
MRVAVRFEIGRPRCVSARSVSVALLLFPALPSVRWHGQAVRMVWPGLGPVLEAERGRCPPPQPPPARPATSRGLLRGCGDVMPILESSWLAARSSCCVASCPAWPHLPSQPPSVPRSGAIPFPRSLSKVRVCPRSRLLSSFVPCPRGPETLNTGQGSVRSSMSQARYYALHSKWWCLEVSGGT